MRAFLLFLTTLVMAASIARAEDAPAPVAEKSDAQKDCESKGGFWAGNVQGRGRIWGCITKTKDAGKPCRDGSECEAHFCIVQSADCDGTITHLPKGTGYEHCVTKGICFERSFPPKGCYGFLVRGQYQSWCAE